jgi:hypothetical protein
MAKAKLVKVTVKLPWVEGVWEADEKQQLAAWEMYVELITRVAVQPLGPDQGLLREALTSLHSLFGEARRILRQYGPCVATPARPEALSFGKIAVDVLNRSLRPLLAKWHPVLGAYESSRPSGQSPLDHERAWTHSDELRVGLAECRQILTAYADLLAAVCGIAPLHEPSPRSP